MGSASSVGIAHSGDERDRDGFVFPFPTLNGEDTEVELQRRRRDQPSPPGHSGPTSRQGTLGHALADRDRPPTPQPRGGSKRVPPDVAAHPLPARITLLPHTFSIGPLSVTLNRKRCEDILLLGAVVVGIAKLAYTWNEWALAGELSTLLILSIAYTGLRVRTVRNPLPPSPTGTRARLPHAPPMPTIRERNRRASHASNGRPGSPAPSRSGSMVEDEPLTVGARGCIWGTEEREYRECLDDGALFALLLSPLTAAALLHGALSMLASDPDSALLPGWEVEPPLVIPTTPIRRISATVPHGTSDTVLALSALATGRRNLVQLFTLLSFVLLVQLSWSLRREVRFAKGNLPPPPVVSIGPGTGASGSAPSVSGHSDGESERSAHGTYWLRRGEWRRNGSVIGFAFVVTGGCVIVKIVTAYVGHGVWSDMSHSDIVIATLFYQFCLYVCVRLARRGFTLGELGIVTHAATALFMETVNLTRTQIPIFRMAYIKTYRLPTPLLIFQLALIPGSLLTGFLLSPILYLARHLAQRPAHRLRFPHEKPMHRRLLAIAFYAGALLVVVGIVGTWTRWMLGWRNPWLWVIFFLVEGKHAWTRPILISYWGVLAMVSVAGWQRQLSRARRHRRYVVPGREGSASASSSISSAPASAVQDASSVGSGGMSGVATQMMDAADKRVPTLSINARRKSFHALAVAMFIPGIAVDPAFTHLSFSVAFAAFTFAEYVRYFALWPLGASVHIFLNEFIDHKDSGTAILSHFYLLAGCATPLWFEGPSQLLSYFGILSLGIGDALASIVGRRIGYARWTPVSGKTAEGSAAFLASVVGAGVFMWIIGLADAFAFVPYVVATALATLLEAFSAQNDNLVLPVYGWAVGTLLGV